VCVFMNRKEGEFATPYVLSGQNMILFGFVLDARAAEWMDISVMIDR
jgi:hypothetical protein